MPLSHRRRRAAGASRKPEVRPRMSLSLASRGEQSPAAGRVRTLSRRVPLGTDTSLRLWAGGGTTPRGGNRQMFDGDETLRDQAQFR